MVEVTIVLAIFGVLMLVVVSALTASGATLSQSTMRIAVDDAAVRIMNQIVADVRLSGPSAGTGETDDDDDSDMNVQAGSVGLESGSPKLKFRRVARWNASTKAIDWSSEFVTWRWRPASTAAGYRQAETIDGRDNNGNGLVDEGYVTRQEGTGAERVIAINVLYLAIPRWTEPDGVDNDGDGQVDESGEGNGLDDNGNGKIDEVGDQWNISTSSTAVTTLSSQGGTVESHGVRFARGASPRDDQLTIVVTVAGQLEDGNVYFRQLVETVLLRN